MEASWADGWLRAAVREAASKPLPHTREELEDFRTLGRAHLLRSLGLEDLPHNHRPPPPAHPSGSASYSGFRLERWVLETRPGVKATVLLYRPEGRGPFPVILNPHGHWPLKKAEPVVQARAIEQARSGFLAVVVDSPGHSWEGDRPVERKALGTHWDFVPTCAGITATGVYVWDLVRTLDFVQTLPFADADRVGITGESGGGTATVYTFAVDRRIRCAVPVVYACSLEDQPDNGCPCNHLPDILSLGDRAHALAIRAPSPVLLLGATDDEEFPPDAMRKTAAKLSEMGRKLGFDDFAGVEIFEGPHTYSEPMRQVALRFFDTHLRPDRPASVRG
ncbi:MAG: CocE/NonD family hydrolase, partial [Fimbriimonadales bacterium]